MRITLLNCADFKPYSLSMIQALISHGVSVEVIGNDDLRSAPVMTDSKISYYNLRGDQSRKASVIQKMTRVSKFYLRLLKYAATTGSPLFHMQCHNKFALFDRVVLNSYYKLLGKKLVFTAHNIDAKERDGGNSLLNRWSLGFSYRLMDHIFVHTEKMKEELVEAFKLDQDRITIIPHGILNTAPVTPLSREEARERLSLEAGERALLFFGYIAPYKGLEYLIEALGQLKREGCRCRLIIGGEVKDCAPYWRKMEELIEEQGVADDVIKEIRYISDGEVEVFFKAADALVLPYRFIFQSGLPFLSYSFGLPIIASDAGSLGEVVVEGKTGLVCRKEDPADLAAKIADYFESDLYHRLAYCREMIRKYGNDTYSWDRIGATINGVYSNLLALPAHEGS
jgi:D-inositol-3-phosphate glycosyltransferase